MLLLRGKRPATGHLLSRRLNSNGERLLVGHLGWVAFLRSLLPLRGLVLIVCLLRSSHLIRYLDEEILDFRMHLEGTDYRAKTAQ